MQDDNMGRRTEQRILVGSSNNLQSLLGFVVSQPTPSRSLDGGSLGVDLVFEVLE
jgi:hypothetical protein